MACADPTRGNEFFFVLVPLDTVRCESWGRKKEEEEEMWATQCRSRHSRGVLLLAIFRPGYPLFFRSVACYFVPLRR